jgi:cytochrome c biogenesis protein CcmG/thiol:disulfide interchange protein DsbE
VKRNSIVLFIVLFVLATFAWAGWANFEYRKQAAERLLATAAKGELVVDASGAADYVSPLDGKPAPAFSLEDLSGKKVSLADYKGKAVLVNFWATWCAPCKIETPWIVELRNQYAAQGFEVLGISADDLDKDDPKKLDQDKKDIAHSAEQLHISYPVLIDGGSLDKQYGGLDELPMSFFVDRSGTVVAVQMGISSKDDMESNIKKALAN